MNTGQRLKEYAALACGSVKRLADEIGERPDNLQKYASGRHEPGAKLLRKLAAHGCNVHWLLTGEGDVYADASSGRERDVEEREILRVLRSEGIRDARTLKSLLADIRRMFDIRSRIAKKLDQ
jgi:transcriptional regulator with XRE-family HTH domain